MCSIHNDKFTSYCNECKTNLCISCEKIHNKTHKIIYYKDISYNTIDIKENITKY